jgi:hypothetical protein
MHNLLWPPIAVAAGRDVAESALPDAPVVARARRPRRRATRLQGEQRCDTCC